MFAVSKALDENLKCKGGCFVFDNLLYLGAFSLVG